MVCREDFKGKYADIDDFVRLLDHTRKLKRQTGAAVATDSI